MLHPGRELAIGGEQWSVGPAAGLRHFSLSRRIDKIVARGSVGRTGLIFLRCR